MSVYTKHLFGVMAKVKKRKEESPEISLFLVLNIFRICLGLFLSCSLHLNFIQIIDFAYQAISKMKTDQACLKAFELDWAKRGYRTWTTSCSC